MLRMIREAAAAATALAGDLGNLQFACDYLNQRNEHPGGQCAFKIVVTLPWGEVIRLKCEVTQDEPVLLPARPRDIFHGYPPEPDTLGCIRAYDVNEVAAEKLRAYLQVYQTLQRRAQRPGRTGWVKGRSRDTYDLAQLYRSGHLQPNRIAEILPRKAAVRDVSFDGPKDFQRPEIMAYYRDDWQQNLVPFVPLGMAPPFEDAVAAVEALIAAVFEYM